MHFTLSSVSNGAITIIVTRFLFIQGLIFRKIKNLPKILFVLFLKLRARTRNYFFICKEKTALMLHKSKIRRIIFSQKDEWTTIINKSFSERVFQLDFNQFNPLSFGAYDLVVPLTIPDLRICIANKEKLFGQAIPIPSSESVDICNDKIMFNDFMKKNGFAAYIPNTEKPFQYPYMLKKNIDEYGQRTFIIENPEDEHFHFLNLEDSTYYCQELIPGKLEYATHILFREGHIQASLNIRYTFGNNHYIKGKELFFCKEVCQSQHLELFTNILTKIGFEGICCFNYKDVNGKPMVFEINPRFGGSLTDYFFSFIRKLDKVA